MAITNGYTTLDDLKAHLGLPGEDVADDSRLEALIEDVSRWFDKETGRRFYTTDVDETHYYTASWSHTLLLPDDLLSVTTLATDDGSRTYSTVWAATDYDLEPVNELPYWEIRRAPNGSYSFPVGVARGVKIVGKFGYCTLANRPRDIGRAVLIRCGQLWALGPAPFNEVGGAGAKSNAPAAWPVVKDTIEQYRVWRVG